MYTIAKYVPHAEICAIDCVVYTHPYARSTYEYLYVINYLRIYQQRAVDRAIFKGLYFQIMPLSSKNPRARLVASSKQIVV